MCPKPTSKEWKPSIVCLHAAEKKGPKPTSKEWKLSWVALSFFSWWESPKPTSKEWKPIF